MPLFTSKTGRDNKDHCRKKHKETKSDFCDSSDLYDIEHTISSRCLHCQWLISFLTHSKKLLRSLYHLFNPLVSCFHWA